MTVLPRLDDLVWLTYARRDDRDGVLKTYTRDRGVEQSLYKKYGIRLATVSNFFREMPGTTDGKMSAGGMGNHQVPVVADDVEHVPLIVRPGLVSRQQVA